MKRHLYVFAALAALFGLGNAAPARADAVTDWNRHATTAITVVARQPPPVAALSFAMVQGAVYDAVNAIDHTYRPYLAAPVANPWDSQGAAAATAAFRVLSTLFAAQAPGLRTLYEASLAQEPNGSAKDGGVAAGEQAAAAMLAARAHDGRGGSPVIQVGSTPGAWRPTPPVFLLDPASWLANVTPFFVSDVEALRSDGPNALSSKAYARDFAEVKEIGSASSTTRTADQTQAAFFWHDTVGPWHSVFRSLAEREGLSTAASARLFAMVYLAAADGGIACWNDKYHWSFWRPVTAIREAAADGNPETEPDPGWTPLLFTPPFPEHPSGHSCASSAIVHTLQQFFGRDRVTFTGTASTGSTRSYTSFSQALEEVIDARVWGGIHFREADVQGARIGKDVAKELRKRYFRPLRFDSTT
jgi:hypothetical protein